MNGQVELARLVDLAAKQTSVPIEYDASALKGAVTLRVEGSISDDELWALLNRVLSTRGFTTVLAPGSEVVSVVKLADAAAMSRLSGADAGGALELTSPIPRTRVGYQTIVVRLKHRSPKEAIEAIGKVLSKPGGAAVALTEETVREPRATGAGGAAASQLPSSGSGGLLMVSDLVPRLEQAMELLRAIDAPTSGATIQSVPVRSVSPTALASLVMQLAQKREEVSGQRIPGEVIASTSEEAVLIIATPERVGFWRELISQLDRKERQEEASYSSVNYAPGELAAILERSVPLGSAGDVPAEQRTPARTIVVDELTATVVVRATASEHEAIRVLIERLDSAPGAKRTQVKSFRIRHRAVSDLVPILQQLMRSELGEGAGGDWNGDITSPRRPEETRAPLPPVTADDARPRGMAASGASSAVPGDGRGGWARDGAEGARERVAPPITFTADDATNTLLAMGEPRVLEQLAGLIEELDVRQPQVMLEVLLVSLTDSQTLDLGIELEKLDLDGDIQWRLSSLFGLSNRTGTGNVTAGGAGGTAVVLRPGDFSVVLRALQTLNNGRSLSMPMVLVTNNEQATLDSTLEQPFASTTSPSNSNSTTSFGGSLPAGTQISIKPQIGDADQLTLDYQLSLSSFSGAAASPNLPPPRQQNRVQSVATIPDGHVVVVGGIELQTDGRASSQIPLLGDIPVIGEAFKTRSRNTSKQRFYVFIRANVLRQHHFEDLKYLSGVRTSETRVDDGWPKAEPGMIR